MTRRKEIEWEAGGIVNRMIDRGVSEHYDTYYQAFQDGATWADKTMIEKARQWFNLHFRQVGTPKEIKHDFESKEKMWKSFTQFMEE